MLLNFGYGWVCPLYWLCANVGWWAAFVAGHYGEPGMAAIALMLAYFNATAMTTTPWEPAYTRFARWEYREQENTTSWCVRSIRETTCTTRIFAGCRRDGAPAGSGHACTSPPSVL